ncbi:hypothetical protein LBMAG53_35960 [Planctomycetota bacterium]|nr:hypothetical protein LBMAG53_35960 [Planctomycetota bacterium]
MTRSQSDDGSPATGAAGLDPGGLTRRGILVLGGAGVLGGASVLAGCVRESPQTKAINQPAAPLQIEAEPGVWYSVAAGDTLSSISRRAGIPVASIQEANRLAGIAIKPGQRLWLPGTNAIAERIAVAEKPIAGPQGPVLQPGEEPYRLVPRSTWTNQKIAANHVLLDRVDRITVHHTGEHGHMADLNDIAVIRGIERYHHEDRGWAAIGYHYLVGRDGAIYEGRPIKFQGAHVSGSNANNLGVTVIGDFSKAAPSARQLASLRAFLEDSRARYRLPLAKIYGHRDLRPTICPGDGLYAWLKQYRTG